jgi:hypothetical protein
VWVRTPLRRSPQALPKQAHAQHGLTGVRYRVAVVKRIDSEGHESSLEPSEDVDTLVPDGVVADKVFVEHLESDAEHNKEVLDEDDAFLGSATAEVWEYEIVDERAAEFEEAIRRSRRVLEFEPIDTDLTEPDEALDEIPSDASRLSRSPTEEAPVTGHGSGVRAGDDGPAGQPTGDPSAGGLEVGAPDVGPIEEGEPVESAPDQIDDLNVLKSRDPRLGLTNRGKKPAENWAANTGQTRNPDQGIEEDALGKADSTLGNRRRR